MDIINPYKICYIAMPYTSNHVSSVQRSMNAYKELLELGIVPYSPILETHFLYDFNKLWFDSKKDNHEIFMKLDLAKCEKWCGEKYEDDDIIVNPNLYFLFPNDWKESSGCVREWKFAKNRNCARLLLEPFLKKRLQYAILEKEPYWSQNDPTSDPVQSDKSWEIFALGLWIKMKQITRGN